MISVKEHKQLASDGLKEVKQILSGFNIPFYLAFGTALGAYRQGDFNEGDIDDIDLFINEVDYKHRKKIEAERL